MKRACLIAFVILLGAHCAPGSAATPAPQEVTQVAPPEFAGVDFANFAYPATAVRKGARLRQGELERPDPVSGGEWLRLNRVGYVDVDGDGKKEAFVIISATSCGGSCDGGAHQFFIYTGGRTKPRLLWKMETGSQGYGCGLKSLAVRGRRLSLELFRDCRFDGETFDVKNEEPFVMKFRATVFTRFDFETVGKRVVLRSREVFPFPRGEMMNHHSEISISDE